MHLKAVNCKETQSVTENIQVVLIVRLTLVQKADLELFFSLVRWTVVCLLHDLIQLVVCLSFLLIVWVKNKVFIVKILVKNVLSLSHLVPMALEMHCVQVVIMKLANKLFELVCVLVQMDVGNLIWPKTCCHPLCLLSLLLSLFLLLLSDLIQAINSLNLLSHPIDFVLHSVLLFDHLSFQRDVEGPLVILFVVVKLLKGPFGLVFCLELILEDLVVVVLLLGDLDHGLLDLWILFKTVIQQVVLDSIDLAITLTDTRDWSVAILLEKDIVITKIGAVRIDGKWHIEAAILLHNSSHINYLWEIDVKHHRTMEDEENFFCLVTLTEKDVIVKQVQRFQLWNNVDQEILWLVSEKSDSLDDLTMGWLNDVSTERRGKLLEQRLPVSIIANGFGLVLEKVFNLCLGAHWQVVFKSILI